MTAGKAGADTATERLLRRDRWIIGGGLLLICLLCWLYLLTGAGTGMNVAAMAEWRFPPPVTGGMNDAPWDASRWSIMLFMWWTMMIAMMVPSAAPMILLYAKVFRHGQKSDTAGSSVVPAAAFAGGYVLVWLIFSTVAVILQFALEQSGLVDRMMMWSTNAALSGVFFVLAGLYQFSPWKNQCLSHCRSPVAFLTAHWKMSRAGAMRMGLEHGLYCVGCCWSLMLLLFVGGVMNLLWIAGLAVIVLVEKLHRAGRWFARGAGLVMIATGIILAV